MVLRRGSGIVLCLSLLAWAGCDTVGSSADDDVSESVTVGFSVAEQSSTSSAAPSKASSGEGLVIEGTNGTLRLSNVRLIVSGMELKVAEDASGESCEFETPASYLDLPLTATTVAAVGDADIPEDTYDEFEFEVEDVDPDDEDLSNEERAHLEALLDTIRADYEDWPTNASMVAVGTFTPTDGEAVDFRTYFEAEIEIELELDPPLEITTDGRSRSITVRLDPAQWFTRADGTVVDLSAFDRNVTDDLYELEAEFEDGVAEIELDDD